MGLKTGVNQVSFINTRSTGLAPLSRPARHINPQRPFQAVTASAAPGSKDTKCERKGDGRMWREGGERGKEKK